MNGCLSLIWILPGFTVFYKKFKSQKRSKAMFLYLSTSNVFAGFPDIGICIKAFS